MSDPLHALPSWHNRCRWRVSRSTGACAVPKTTTNSNINMRRKHFKPSASSRSLTPIVGACLGGVLLAGLPTTNAQAQGAEAARMEKLEKENAELKKRLDALEGKDETASPKNYVVKALSEISIKIGRASCRERV